MYTLYKITNLLNNKHYIGVTSRNPNERFSEHKKSSSNSFISKAIRADGIENFSFEIILTNIKTMKFLSQNVNTFKNIILYFLMDIMPILAGLNIINILIILKVLFQRRVKGIKTLNMLLMY